MAADKPRSNRPKREGGVEKERERLKKLIGFPERSTEEIQKQFADRHADLRQREEVGRRNQKAAADKPLFDAEHLYYSRLLAGHEQGHPGPSPTK